MYLQSIAMMLHIIILCKSPNIHGRIWSTFVLSKCDCQVAAIPLAIYVIQQQMARALRYDCTDTLGLLLGLE